MVFNPNTDVNYALYLAAVAPLSGTLRSDFDAFLIREFSLQCTLGTTLVTSTTMAAMIAAALSSAKEGVYQF
jgi:hypothetical protein